MNDTCNTLELRNLSNLRDSEFIERRLKRLKQRMRADALWTVVREEGNPLGVKCTNFSYFIDKEDLTESSHIRGIFMGVQDWRKHLRCKYWFNEQSEFSFLNACKELKEEMTKNREGAADTMRKKDKNSYADFVAKLKK